MDTFFTWDYLLTFAGCALATGLVTEFTKPLFKNIPTQLISYFFALIIMTVAQLATKQLTTWEAVVLNLVNAVVVSLASNGGYDAVKKAFVKKTDTDTELTDEGDE